MDTPDSAATNEYTDAQPRRRWTRESLLTLGLIALNVLGLLFINTLTNAIKTAGLSRPGLESKFTIAWLATPFAQASLLAFWTGVSPRSAAYRFTAPLAPLIGICLLSFFWGQIAFRRSGSLPSIALIAQWLITSLLFNGVFRARGWRLRRRDLANALTDQPQLFQFGIKHLLIWTTLIAAVLAIGRVIVPQIQWDRGDVPGFALFGTFNCIYLVPLMALALRDRKWLIGVLLALLWTALVTLAEQLAFVQVYGRQDHSYLFGLNAVQAIVIVGSLLLARAAQWRLMRSPGLGMNQGGHRGYG